MNFYEELNAEFSTATQHFKAGNHLLFFRDMTHKLSDLLFTKGEVTNLPSTPCVTLLIFVQLKVPTFIYHHLQGNLGPNYENIL